MSAANEVRVDDLITASDAAFAARTLVRGRLVHFLRRAPHDGWRIRLLMNSQSHPRSR